MRGRNSCTLMVMVAGAIMAREVATAAEPTPSAVATKGTISPVCGQSSNSWTSSDAYDSKLFGNYIVSNDNFNNTPGQLTWANSASCWGTTTTSVKELNGVGSYPHIVRGWTASNKDMAAFSTPKTLDWTTRSGMGVPVSQLTKANVHWAFTAPSAPSARWMGLIDVYLHPKIATSWGDFPPFVDLMVNQALADAVMGDHVTTFFQYMAKANHAAHVTIAGTQYLVYVDDSGESGFHQAGGHNIHLFREPTSFTVPSTGANWGVRDGVTDVAAIIKFFMQPHPIDDSGLPLHRANGEIVSEPLIAANLFLNAINVGWEVDMGAAFRTTDFWIAMQGEPDGPQFP